MQDNPIFFEAIARHLCIEAIYNRSTVRLEPHILYTRNDALYLDAITAERDRLLPRERKLGTFRLSGLNDVSLTPHQFQPDPLFDPDDAKYADVTLFKIETKASNPAD